MIFTKLLVFIGFIGVSAMAQAEYVVIVNPSIGQGSMSRNELKAILFGNKTSLGGVTVEPCLLGTKEGEGVFATVLGTSKTQFNQEWVKKELTGSGRAPKTRDSVDDLISCVADAKGGLGVIPRSASAKGEGKVKVLEIRD